MDNHTAYNYIRSKFVKLRETRALIKKHGLKIKYGLLSEDEVVTVKTIINKFLAERRFTMKDFKKHLAEDTEFPIHDLLYECTQACTLRTYKSIHTHIAYIYHPYIHIKWNEEEEIQLLDLVTQKGFKWKEISYHLLKYKDFCRLKYLDIKGERPHLLTKSRIQELLKKMPSTDQEWAALCSELRLNRAYIKRSISKYLNGKALNTKECGELDIRICLLVLNNNHYCKFNVNIDNILNFLNSGLETFDIIDKLEGSTTPFISKRGMKSLSRRLESKHDQVNKSKVDDGETLEANYEGDDGDEDFEKLLEDIKNTEKKNQSHTKFLNKFLDFFLCNKDFNLDIVIKKEDIFWFNVTRDINIERNVLLGKFNQLSSQYGWKMYKDIYDSLMKMAYDYVMNRIRQSFIDKMANKDFKSTLIEEEGDLIEEEGDLIEEEGDLIEEKGDLIEEKGDLVQNKENMREKQNSIDLTHII
ncbi:hypothetical protein GINT2_000757 [Glugoides intestinalis]